MNWNQSHERELFGIFSPKEAVNRDGQAEGWAWCEQDKWEHRAERVQRHNALWNLTRLLFDPTLR